MREMRFSRLIRNSVNPLSGIFRLSTRPNSTGAKDACVGKVLEIKQLDMFSRVGAARKFCHWICASYQPSGIEHQCLQ